MLLSAIFVNAFHVLEEALVVIYVVLYCVNNYTVKYIDTAMCMVRPFPVCQLRIPYEHCK